MGKQRTLRRKIIRLQGELAEARAKIALIERDMYGSAESASCLGVIGKPLSTSWRVFSTLGEPMLSRIEWVKPEEVKPVEFAEIEIQSAFEKKLSDLEDRPEHVHSLIKTPVGAIEVHAIDPKKRPANVEFKKPDGLE